MENTESNNKLHIDSQNLLKECFSQLEEKMIRNQEKYGYSNEWLMHDWEDECRENMMSHIEKGDPKDVAIYAMFMMFRGWSTKKVIRTPNVESHDYGRLIYFNNVLVRSNDLNASTNYEYWLNVAKENPNFCPRIFHDNLSCENCNCQKKQSI